MNPACAQFPAPQGAVVLTPLCTDISYCIKQHNFTRLYLKKHSCFHFTFVAY